ncbi:MAG: transposase [Deltaproteobacteria bacterium]|nr:transposase [Deltaproteobacteria bacterium]
MRNITKRCLKEYNEERPHESLGNLTSAEYLAANNPKVSTSDWD